MPATEPKTPWPLPTPAWDAHMHVHKLPGHPWDSPPERALALMDACGVEKAVIMPYNEIGHENGAQLELDAEMAATYPGRFLLFARLHPGEGGGAEELLEHAVRDLGYVGLKLHPVGSKVAPADPRCVNLVRKAAALGVPVLFHCGDEPLTLPEDIGPLAERVPEATILLGHAGGYFHVPSALEWARRCPNLVFETSATPDLRTMRRAIDQLGPERFVYGSDGPGCVPRLELHKVRLLLRGHEAAASQVLCDNLRRLLPLPKEA
jgi:uncharacterized protein